MAFLQQNTCEFAITRAMGERLRSRSKYFESLLRHEPDRTTFTLHAFLLSPSDFVPFPLDYPSSHPTSLLRPADVQSFIHAIRILTLPSSAVYTYISSQNFNLHAMLDVVSYLESRYLYMYLLHWYMDTANLATFMLYAYHFYGPNSQTFKDTLDIFWLFMDPVHPPSLSSIYQAMTPLPGQPIDVRLDNIIYLEAVQSTFLLYRQPSIRCNFCLSSILPDSVNGLNDRQLAFMPCCGTTVHPTCILEYLHSMCIWTNGPIQPHSRMVGFTPGIEVYGTHYFTRAISSTPLLHQLARPCRFCGHSFNLTSFISSVELFYHKCFMHPADTSNLVLLPFIYTPGAPIAPTVYATLRNHILRLNPSFSFPAPTRTNFNPF